MEHNEPEHCEEDEEHSEDENDDEEYKKKVEKDQKEREEYIDRIRKRDFSMIKYESVRRAVSSFNDCDERLLWQLAFIVQTINSFTPTAKWSWRMNNHGCDVRCTYDNGECTINLA